MAGLFLPTLEEQRNVVAILEPARLQSESIVEKARRLLETAEKTRYSYLHRFFGSPQQFYLRNPQFVFGDVIKLKNGDPDADFWIMRSGQEHRVGKPFDRNDPNYVEMESKEDWGDRPTTTRGRYHLWEGRVPRTGLDPRNHIGVTVKRPEILLPEFLYYVAEYAWNVQIYRKLCHGTLRLQHIRHRDVKCALTTVLSALQGRRRNPYSYRRNMDETIRELERKLAISNSRQDAVNLCVAKMRLGDENAPRDFYSWLYNNYLEHADNLVEWGSRVWVVTSKEGKGEIFCDECGEEEAWVEADRDGLIPRDWFPNFHDHPDYEEFNLDQTHEFLRDNYSYSSLIDLLHKHSEFDPDGRLVCAKCKDVIKLRTDPIPWEEALKD